MEGPANVHWLCADTRMSGAAMRLQCNAAKATASLATTTTIMSTLLFAQFISGWQIIDRRHSSLSLPLRSKRFKLDSHKQFNKCIWWWCFQVQFHCVYFAYLLSNSISFFSRMLNTFHLFSSLFLSTPYLCLHFSLSPSLSLFLSSSGARKQHPHMNYSQ